MKTTLLLIRHAESIYINGKEKSRPLSEKGLFDAKKLHKSLEGYNIDALFASDYKRAVQTIDPLAAARDLTIHEVEALRERRLKADSIHLDYDDFIQAVKQSFSDSTFSLVGGESVVDVQERAIPIIEGILSTYKGKTVAIGSHGNIMTMILNYYRPGYGYDFWSQLSIPDVYELTFENNRLIDVKQSL